MSERSTFLSFISGRVALAGVALILTVGGCTEGAGIDLVLVSDSAGVSMVENRASEPELADLALFDTPSLELGVLEGEDAYTFSSIQAVRGLAGGGVLVAEAQARELRVFDASGRHVRTLGGRGGGPGEFETLSGIAGLVEDTAWVWDSRSQRLTTFLLTGELVGTLPGEGDAYGRISELHRLPDGTFVARSSWSSRDPGIRDLPDVVIVRDSLVLRHLDQGLRTIDTLAVLPAAESLRQVSSQRSGDGAVVTTRQMSRPLGRSTHFSLGGGGVITATSDSFQWAVLDLQGRPQLVSRAPGLERSVTPAVVERLRGWFLTFAETGEQEREMSALLDDYPLPDEIPAFRDIQVDPSGRVWFAKYKVVPDDADIWYVFSSAGALIGQVRPPHGLEIHEIGADYILGVKLDEFDVQYVVRLPMAPVN